MRGNPIPEIIPDHIYYLLESKGFLNERTIRDFYMKKRFHQLRKDHSAGEIFSILQSEFPYLCEDTIRKIIYSRNGFSFQEISGDTQESADQSKKISYNR